MTQLKKGLIDQFRIRDSNPADSDKIESVYHMNCLKTLWPVLHCLRCKRRAVMHLRAGTWVRVSGMASIGSRGPSRPSGQPGWRTEWSGSRVPENVQDPLGSYSRLFLHEQTSLEKVCRRVPSNPYTDELQWYHKATHLLFGPNCLKNPLI